MQALTVSCALLIGILATVLHASFQTRNLKAHLNTFREESRAVWHNFSELEMGGPSFGNVTGLLCLIMSRPMVLVFLLMILIITSRFEWKQQLVPETAATPSLA